MKNLFLVLFSTLFIFGPMACNKKGTLRDYKGSYLESVRLNYQAGVKSLKDEDYEKALAYFQFVRNKYPYSNFAALADLRIADTKYKQKRFINAASSYEVFIRLHPRHEEVPYASYKIGASYFEAIPNDFFILPPSYARDQSFTKEALAALDRFILSFPNTKYVSDAQEKRKKLFSALAKHNQEIANYYMKRKRYQAAFDRHLRVVELYPNIDEALESMLMAASIAEKSLEDFERAVELYGKYIGQVSDEKKAEQAKKALTKVIKKLSEES